MKRLASVVIVVGLVVSFTTGIRPAGAAPAQLPTNVPVYPWDAEDDHLQLVAYEAGSQTQTLAQLGRTAPIVANGLDFSQGYTVEGWLKTPDGTALPGFHFATLMRQSGACVNNSVFPNTSGYTLYGRQRPMGTCGNSSTTGPFRYYGANPTVDWSDWVYVTYTYTPGFDYHRRFCVNGICDGGSGSWDAMGDEASGTIAMLSGNPPEQPLSSVVLCDARISVGGLTQAGLLARYDAFQNGEVTGCQEAPELPPGAYAPRISCGRTLRDMGNGTWWADAEALVMNPTDGASDSEGEWRTSWSSDVYSGRNALIPLPPNAAERTDLFLSYYMERSHTQEVGWSPDYETGAEWYDGVEIHGDTPFAYTLPGASLLRGFLGGGEQQHGAGWYTVDVDGDGVVGDVVQGSAITRVKKVGAGCTIRVAPPTNHQDPPVIIINFPPHPDDTSGGGETPPPPNDECASEDGGLIGVISDIVEWLGCRLGGLGDIFGDLLGGLLDWLIDNLGGFDISKLPFLDGLEADWRGKFPLSVIGDIDGLATGIHDRIDSGVNGSPCSTIDPNLDGAINHEAASGLDVFRITLPTPTGACGESDQLQNAADLLGWRGPLRAFLGVFVWLAFVVRVVTSFGPGRTGLEPDPEEAVR